MLTILIDADSMVYRAAWASEVPVPFGEDGMVHACADKVEAWSRVEADLGHVKAHVGDGRLILALSDPDRCFRAEFFPSYKSQRRANGRRPLLFQWLREEFAREYETAQRPRLEADDVLGVLATALPGAIVVSIDKDLKGVPCRLWNPMRPDRLPEEIDEAAADRWHLYQTLVGDAVDGYPGCPGVGPVRANRILAADPTWDAVEMAFLDRGLDKDFALTQARCARILRSGDYDHQTGEIKLWTPPTN
jgi:DNA polymerase-1